MNDLLDIILKDTYSQVQLKHRLNILKAYLLNNFFGTLKKQEITEKDLAWLKSLPAAYYQNFNKDNTQNIFTELDQRINQLKLMTIYLTFEPDDYSLSQIGTYARKLFGNFLLLDIKYDPNLIAGAALVWNGVYRDFSLRAKIEEKKALILESFKKYLR